MFRRVIADLGYLVVSMDNTHLQITGGLVDRLIELGKRIDDMAYPTGYSLCPQPDCMFEGTNNPVMTGFPSRSKGCKSTRSRTVRSG